MSVKAAAEAKAEGASCTATLPPMASIVAGARVAIFAMRPSMTSCIKRCLPSRLEPSGIYRSDGKRPDGITLVPWERGLLLVWDAKKNLWFNSFEFVKESAKEEHPFKPLH